jgi:lipopolysaccharide transport system permease protein
MPGDLGVAPGSRSEVAAHRRDILRELLLRDIRLRYRRSVLGLLWSQLSPLSLIVILTVIFTRVVPLGIPNYPVFVFVGLSSWHWFQGGLHDATICVSNNRDLVRLPGFPLGLLPPVSIGSHVTHYVLSLPVLLGAVLVTTGRIPYTAIALPLVLMIQFALCLGPAYVLAPLQVTMRDTAHAVSIALLLLFYATPIIYDERRLRLSAMRPLFDLNPLAHLLRAQRDILLDGRWPDFGALTIVLAVALIVLVIGRRIFVAAGSWMADEV